jgi:hypothetical protein
MYARMYTQTSRTALIVKIAGTYIVLEGDLP